MSAWLSQLSYKDSLEIYEGTVAARMVAGLRNARHHHYCFRFFSTNACLLPFDVRDKTVDLVLGFLSPPCFCLSFVQ